VGANPNVQDSSLRVGSEPCPQILDKACHSTELITAAKTFYDTVPRWNWLSARLFALKVEDEERKNLSFFI